MPNAENRGLWIMGLAVLVMVVGGLLFGGDPELSFYVPGGQP